MKSIETNIGRVIVGKLEPGDDLIEEITNVVKNYKINAGLVNIIGALGKFTIGYFDLNIKQYHFKTFEENVELVSCMGNISYKNGEPVIHLHVSIGREDFSILGGHLHSPTIISITGEVYIYEIEQKLIRAIDPQLGLSLLDL